MTVNLTLIDEYTHVVEMTQVRKDPHGAPKKKEITRPIIINEDKLKREESCNRRGFGQLVLHIADS